MQADPLGYVDGPNQYEHVGSSPVDSVDPEGLAVVRSGADVPLKPITGNPIPMNGRGYAETYIYNPWWGRTYVDDTKWDGDRYNGDINTEFHPLGMPAGAEKCSTEEQAALKQAIDAFNTAARNHEIEARLRFRRHLEEANTRKEFEVWRESQYGLNAPFDLRGQIGMYEKLKDAVKKSACANKGAAERNEKLIDTKIADLKKRLGNRM